MRKTPQILATTLLLLSSAAVFAAGPTDAVADRFLGQPIFNGNTANNGGASAATMQNPDDAAIDPVTGRLYVSDTYNHRILSWPDAATFTSGEGADRIFGQPDATGHTANNGGLDAGSLNLPMGLTFDAAGNLYVSDASNHRVLRYDAPLTDTTADAVYGQINFTSGSSNQGTVNPTASTLNFPHGLAVDSDGNLYISDTNNMRVVRYDSPLTETTTADAVFGQLGSFTTRTSNKGGIGADTLFNPNGVAFDAAGDLYVSDDGNNRVLKFDDPQSDTSADLALGQADLASKVVNSPIGDTSSVGLKSPNGLAVDGEGRLYVSDSGNNRVLRFDPPFATGAAANAVFGQTNFTGSTIDGGIGTGPLGFHFPHGLELGEDGSLFVCDNFNHRMVAFDETCGNGVTEGAEDCDDGNADDADECRNDCTLPVPSATTGGTTGGGTTGSSTGGADGGATGTPDGGESDETSAGTAGDSEDSASSGGCSLVR